MFAKELLDTLNGVDKVNGRILPCDSHGNPGPIHRSLHVLLLHQYVATAAAERSVGT